MTARKRNEFLDLGFSDDDKSKDYDSEAAEGATGAKSGRTTRLTVRGSKRQKLDISDSDDETDRNDSDLGTKSTQRALPTAIIIQDALLAAPPINPENLPTTTPTNPISAIPIHPTPKLLTSTSLTQANTLARKSGVLYLSRIPPFMRPATVKHLLTPFGPINRLFLTPEPPSAYSLRKKAGGNKKRSFIDGWIEFARKRDAKICAESINGEIVGGKKGGWYRDDVWNAKYLRGFGWGDLMAGVRGEEREREERVRVGLGREARERRGFLEGVERGKVEETRRRRRDERGEKKGEEEKGTEGQKGSEGKRGGGFERRFRQNEVSEKKGSEVEQSDEVKRVLSKIF